MTQSDETRAQPQPQPQPQPQHMTPSDGTVLGIVSIAFGALGFIPTFGVLFAGIGLILGIRARKQAVAAGNATGNTLGVIGILLSAVTLVIAVLLLIVMLTALGVLGGKF